MGQYVTIKGEKHYIRPNLYLILDTETANGFANPLTYDVGLAVIDNKGRVYAKYSFAVYDILFGMPQIMETAYYRAKLPRYYEDIKNGKRTVASFALVREIANALLDKWNIKKIVAHNANFDHNALDNTTQFLALGLTFFDRPVEWWCTYTMAVHTIGKQKSYKEWCKRNGFVAKNGQRKLTAEVLARWIYGDTEFSEQHEGLADVLIEKDIFAHIFRQHKKIQATPIKFKK